MEFRGREERSESGECIQAACSPQGWVDHLHFLTALGKGPGASRYHRKGVSFVDAELPSDRGDAFCHHRASQFLPLCPRAMTVY